MEGKDLWVLTKRVTMDWDNDPYFLFGGKEENLGPREKGKTEMGKKGI